MSVDLNQHPPDNHGWWEQMVEATLFLTLVAFGLAAIDAVTPLDLESYFVSILGALGAVVITQWNGPEPPGGSLALKPAL
ncbi:MULTISPECIES: hypothetical protein [Streptomyces]|uniref:hypothetical protein n=1 Tax=Streptomyces TaxID=1883 RepID=UPI0016756089|nr:MULTISPECIES: hypothetical protein [Streptomyces]MBD3575003.1 hypothetical protein [Streptomyces sp. KD18]GGT24043.1 hypothetical protein GCM10010286_56840 [Streptomyces toxytricini]